MERRSEVRYLESGAKRFYLGGPGAALDYCAWLATGQCEGARRFLWRLWCLVALPGREVAAAKRCASHELRVVERGGQSAVTCQLVLPNSTIAS